jgi:cytochrome P450
MEFYNMFNAIIEDRRTNPQDDLATTLATAQLENGEPMGLVEILGYYLIVFNAGHDTTRHSLSGAIKAFLDFPDQLERLRTSDSSILGTAADEIVRWTAPVNYMKRSALRDIEYDGVTFEKGDALALFYNSANRDETVFEDPYQFDIARSPNRHLGFGWAEHYCLGAHLARASIVALLEQIRDRVELLEPAGNPTWTSSSFVVGLKHLPVRYRISS